MEALKRRIADVVDGLGDEPTTRAPRSTPASSPDPSRLAAMKEEFRRR